MASFLIARLGITNAQDLNVTTPQTEAHVGNERLTKGNWMVGGSIGSLGYSFEAESFNINLEPRVGYFVADNFAIGLEAQLGFQSVKGEDNDNIWRYGISPFARYYFNEGSSSTGRFFGQGNLGIAGGNAGIDTSFAFGVNAGYVHFVTRTVGLEAMVGYNYSKSTTASAVKQSGLGASVGFQIYLPGKTKE